MSELKRTEQAVLGNLKSVNVVFLPEQMAPGNSPLAREQVPAAKGRGKEDGAGAYLPAGSAVSGQLGCKGIPVAQSCDRLRNCPLG